MYGALFLKAIAAACVLLCLSATCVGTAAMPSAFTIKSTRGSSEASGSFSVTGSSRSISLSAGVTYEITCTSGTVVGSIAQRWYRDGSAVTKKMGMSMCGSQSEVYYQDGSINSNNWVLTFCNFSSSMMGSYTCIPSPNDNRTLIIEESNPSIIADRDIISEDDGGTATTQAVFLSGVPTPSPDEVTWFVMGEAVTGPNPRKSATTGGLRFNLFSLDTAGIYTCVVNTLAGVSTDSFTVRIRAPPELTLSAQYRYKSKTVFSTSSTFHVPLNANLTFTCTDEHAYPTPTFTWSRNGTAITDVQTVSSNQTKHIQYNVQETSTGPYKCMADNGVGNTETTLHIVVVAPPSLTHITDKHTSVLVGGKLSLLVAFNASHKPLTVNWTKVMSGGVLAPIEAGGRVVFDGQHSLNLSIAGVVPEDAGLYELNVVNEVDSVVLQFNVFVFEPPMLTILNPATQNISVPPKSSLTIRVAISSAIPAVLSQDILWSTSKGQTSFNGSLATLQLSDMTEPISLTLTVHHAVGIKSVFFNVVIQSIGPVLNLRFNPSFSQVLWDPPSTVGVLSGLTYQVILISNEVIVSKTTDNTYYPLPALQPCQYYTANVTAFSSEYHGDSAIFKQRINSNCSEYSVPSMSQDAAVNPNAKTVSTSSIIGYTPSPSNQSTAAELDDTSVFIICVSGGFLIMLVILVTTVILLLSRILKHKKDDARVTDQIPVDDNPAYITIKKIDMDN